MYGWGERVQPVKTKSVKDQSGAILMFRFENGSGK